MLRITAESIDQCLSQIFEAFKEQDYSADEIFVVFTMGAIKGIVQNTKDEEELLSACESFKETALTLYKKSKR